MKKFSQMNDTNKSVNTSDNKKDFIKNLIDESLSIENNQIVGKDILYSTLQEILDISETKVIISVLENVKAKSFHSLNLEWINESIDSYKKSLTAPKINEADDSHTDALITPKKVNENVSIITESANVPKTETKDYLLKQMNYLAKEKYGKDYLTISHDKASNDIKGYKELYDKYKLSDKKSSPADKFEEPVEKVEESLISTGYSEDIFTSEINNLSKLIIESNNVINEEHHLNTRAEKIEFILDNLSTKYDLITKYLSTFGNYVKNADIEETLNGLEDADIETLYLAVEK
jgi:hypothetical protein